MPISVIVPAYNEETSIPETLQSIKTAIEFLKQRDRSEVELLVVDNGSTDATSQVVRDFNVRLIQESVRGVSNARNAGANATDGDILVFIDADVTLPETTLWRISQTMMNAHCIGGTVDTLYRPASVLVRRYLRAWRLVGRLLHVAQGAIQFYRRDCFFSLGGYDETIYMGEDVDLYWRLTRKAKKQGFRVCVIDDIQVVPSSRRFDQWPLWKTILWTNPLLVLLLRRRRQPWDAWYRHPPR